MSRIANAKFEQPPSISSGRVASARLLRESGYNGMNRKRQSMRGHVVSDQSRVRNLPVARHGHFGSQRLRQPICLAPQNKRGRSRTGGPRRSCFGLARNCIGAGHRLTWEGLCRGLSPDLPRSYSLNTTDPAGHCAGLVAALVRLSHHSGFGAAGSLPGWSDQGCCLLKVDRRF